MSCEYCQGTKAIISDIDKLSKKGDFYPGIIISIYEGMLCAEAVADTYEPNYMDTQVRIKYCPMCGENLEEYE